MYERLLILLFLLLAVPGGAQSSQDSPAPALPTAREVLIAEKDALTPAEDKEDAFGPDLKTVAWRTERDGKMVVVVNGKEQGLLFDDIQGLQFNTAVTHFTYRGKRNGRWVQVLDGTVLPAEYDEINSAAFPDGHDCAMYGAMRDGKWRLVRDGKEDPVYDEIGAWTSAEGGHLAYAAKIAGKWHVVRDGQVEAPAYDHILFVVLSGDGRRLAYVARKKDRWSAVIDGKEGPRFWGIGGLRFSSDGSRIVYAGVNPSRWTGKFSGSVVIDGVEGKTFRAIRDFPLNRAFGYIKLFFPTLHGVSTPVLSADGKHVAYAVLNGPEDVLVLLDGVPGPSLGFVDEPAISPDGKHVAYLARLGPETHLFVDGASVASVPAELIFGEGTIFAPDGITATAIAMRWQPEMNHKAPVRRRVFLPGQVGREYNCVRIANVTFSADSKHVAYEVHKDGGGPSFVVVDGHEGKHYDKIVPGSARFNPDGSFNYLARQGRKFYRVTLSP